VSVKPYPSTLDSGLFCAELRQIRQNTADSGLDTFWTDSGYQ